MNKKANNIDLGSSRFEKFAQTGALYIDKTMFIEHVLDDFSEVLLFTRPRRMGKTLNLDTFRSFIDVNINNTDELFKGYKIQKSHVWIQKNSHPVIWMSFKDFSIDTRHKTFSRIIKDTARKYLNEDMLDSNYGEDLLPLDSVKTLCEDIEKLTGMKSVVIIDEYDKLYMDSALNNFELFEETESFTKTIMSSCLKDNPSLFKAIITGVNRIAQESMFSDLNNLDIDGVFRTSNFSEDFGLTEEEVQSFIQDENELNKIRYWYNGYTIGDKKVYFTYSVMSYLKFKEFNNYWGLSGVMDTIKNAFTEKRLEVISKLLDDYPVRTNVSQRISGKDLIDFKEDSSFFSLLIQTGYLTHNQVSEENISNSDYLINIPNKELLNVWNDFILKTIYNVEPQTILSIFKHIDSKDSFEKSFCSLISKKLSYFDFDKFEPEKTYHVYILGLLVGCGLKPKSNKESGNGRYDILANINNQNIIFEFKKANSPKEEDLEKACANAIQQIKDKKYASEISNSNPTYLIGIGFADKDNLIRVEKIQ